MSKGGAVVRALASLKYGLGSSPSVDATFWSSLLLVFYLALKGLTYITQWKTADDDVCRRISFYDTGL